MVDGIERDITDVTPEEVETVTILKDAAAVAIYGHKAVSYTHLLFLFSLFAGPLPLSFGGQSAVAANNIMQQQKISVTSKVVDNLGEPIIGANVVVQGQTVGTITDIDGDRKSTRLNSSHSDRSRMPSSA